MLAMHMPMSGKVVMAKGSAVLKLKPSGGACNTTYAETMNSYAAEISGYSLAAVLRWCRTWALQVRSQEQFEGKGMRVHHKEDNNVGEFETVVRSRESWGTRFVRFTPTVSATTSVYHSSLLADPTSAWQWCGEARGVALA